MKQKHTPGPWLLTLLGDLMGEAENGESHHITRCEAIQNRADARLIAAAPELLSALVSIYSMANLEAVLKMRYSTPTVKLIIDQAKLAITKATGES